MQSPIERIANRHVARCLSKIEEVFDLPEICANAMRQEMHYTARDVAEYLTQSGVRTSDDDTDTDANG